MSLPNNHFAHKNAAERYSKGRPYFHHNSILYIKDHLKLDDKLEEALDIACGTGLSTQALLPIAKKVYGTDTSEEMLKWALEPEKISYAIAPAESQPFESSTFDLITVCSGVHWFDIDKFLVESNRLLKPDGWLVLYDNFFISEMMGVEAFSTWYPEVYLNKFPAPKRNNTYDWKNHHLAGFYFQLEKEEQFKNPITYTLDELILYLTTQSNITAMVEQGNMSYEEVESSLYQELTPFFNGIENRTINYGNWIKYLKRLN